MRASRLGSVEQVARWLDEQELEWTRREVGSDEEDAHSTSHSDSQSSSRPSTPDVELEAALAGTTKDSHAIGIPNARGNQQDDDLSSSLLSKSASIAIRSNGMSRRDEEETVIEPMSHSLPREEAYFVKRLRMEKKLGHDVKAGVVEEEDVEALQDISEHDLEGSMEERARRLSAHFDSPLLETSLDSPVLRSPRTKKHSIAAMGDSSSSSLSELLRSARSEKEFAPVSPSKQLPHQKSFSFRDAHASASPDVCDDDSPTPAATDSVSGVSVGEALKSGTKRKDSDAATTMSPVSKKHFPVRHWHEEFRYLACSSVAGGTPYNVEFFRQRQRQLDTLNDAFVVTVSPVFTALVEDIFRPPTERVLLRPNADAFPNVSIRVINRCLRGASGSGVTHILEQHWMSLPVGGELMEKFVFVMNETILIDFCSGESIHGHWAGLKSEESIGEVWKSMSAELRARRAVLSCVSTFDKVVVPYGMIMSYLGWRAMVTAFPLDAVYWSEQELEMGVLTRVMNSAASKANDGIVTAEGFIGKNRFCSGDGSTALRKMCAELNIESQRVEYNGRPIDVYGAWDLQCFRDADHRLTLCNASALFPACSPVLPMTSSCGASRPVRLRHELVRTSLEGAGHSAPVAVALDLLDPETRQCKVTIDRSKSVSAAEDFTVLQNHLFEVRVPAVAKCIIDYVTDAHLRTLNDWWRTFSTTFGQLLHRNGVNIRYLGFVLMHIPSYFVEAQAICIAEILARTYADVVRQRWRRECLRDGVDMDARKQACKEIAARWLNIILWCVGEDSEEVDMETCEKEWKAVLGPHLCARFNLEASVPTLAYVDDTLPLPSDPEDDGDRFHRKGPSMVAVSRSLLQFVRTVCVRHPFFLRYVLDRIYALAGIRMTMKLLPSSAGNLEASTQKGGRQRDSLTEELDTTGQDFSVYFYPEDILDIQHCQKAIAFPYPRIRFSPVPDAMSRHPSASSDMSMSGGSITSTGGPDGHSGIELATSIGEFRRCSEFYTEQLGQITDRLGAWKPSMAPLPAPSGDVAVYDDPSKAKANAAAGVDADDSALLGVDDDDRLPPHLVQCQILTLCEHLGRLYSHLRVKEKAEHYALRLLGMLKSFYGANSYDFGDGLRVIGIIYEQLGEGKIAEDYLTRALDILSMTVGTFSRTFAETLLHLAHVYQVQGRADEADACFKNAVEIAERICGGGLKRSMSITAVAKPVGLEPSVSRQMPHLSVETMMPASPSAGGGAAKDIRDQLFVADMLQARAGLAHERGDTDLAESLFSRALTLREQVLNKRHISVANCLFDFAVLYCRSGDYHRAEWHMKRALMIERLFLGGVEHVSLCDGFANLAVVYYNLQQFDQAMLLVLAALEVYLRHVTAFQEMWNQRKKSSRAELYEDPYVTTLSTSLQSLSLIESSALSLRDGSRPRDTEHHDHSMGTSMGSSAFGRSVTTAEHDDTATGSYSERRVRPPPGDWGTDEDDAGEGVGDRDPDPSLGDTAESSPELGSTYVDDTVGARNSAGGSQTLSQPTAVFEAEVLDTIKWIGELLLEWGGQFVEDRNVTSRVAAVHAEEIVEMPSYRRAKELHKVLLNLINRFMISKAELESSTAEEKDRRRRRRAGQRSKASSMDLSEQDPYGSATDTSTTYSGRTPLRGRHDSVQRPQWVSDSARRDCQRCGNTFTLRRRRHHCRRCGGLYCSSCTPYKMVLPDYNYSKPVRICGQCYDACRRS